MWARSSAAPENLQSRPVRFLAGAPWHPLWATLIDHPTRSTAVVLTIRGARGDFPPGKHNKQNHEDARTVVASSPPRRVSAIRL